MADVLRVVVLNHPGIAKPSLRGLIGAIADVLVTGETNSGAEALRLVGATRPDLLLIEIAGAGENALTVARRIARGPAPLLAFVSDDDRCALAAFEIGAIDYLRKPVSSARLRETLDRVRDRLRRGAPQPAPGKAPLDRLPVRRGREILLLPVDQIASIVADHELLHITTVANERHTVSNHRLKDIEACLDARLFVRLSRSALANLRFISKLTPLTGSNYMASLSNRQDLVVSRTQARFLRQRFLRG
jgi:two-component system LytT family response regulator